MKTLTLRSILILAGAVIAVILSPFFIMGAVEVLDAKDIMVIQSPFSGELSVYTDPGPKLQMWGKVTTYPRRDQYSFSSASNQGQPGDQSISTGFNDGGTGKISGVVSWEMPLKTDQVIRLHKEYGSFHAIDQQLIRPMLEKVIFSAGATMSSIESSSERRPEIPQSIDDQLQNGPYLTKVVMATVKDPMSNTDKTVRVVQIATDDKGKPVRASASTIKEYGISLSPVTVNAIVYEESVRKQIAERQTSTQAVQLSQAAALRATQDAITTAKVGEAAAAKAKWEQEAINAKEIALAEKDLAVATKKALTAEQYKKQQVLEGEGDAAKKRLILEADGALDQKLEAYKKVQGYWATAFQNATQPMVPQISMGGGDHGPTTGVNSAQQMMDLLSVKAAKDLGLDLRNAAGAAAKK